MPEGPSAEPFLLNLYWLYFSCCGSCTVLALAKNSHAVPCIFHCGSLYLYFFCFTHSLLNLLEHHYTLQKAYLNNSGFLYETSLSQSSSVNSNSSCPNQNLPVIPDLLPCFPLSPGLFINFLVEFPAFILAFLAVCSRQQQPKWSSLKQVRSYHSLV